MQATYRFPARGSMPAVTMTWYQGAKQAAGVDGPHHPAVGSGVLFVGARGMLLSDYSRHLLLPEERFADFTRPPAIDPRSLGHYAEWIQRGQDGRADDVQLRVRRLADGGEPPGERGLPRRQAASTGTPPR